ncbi:MAG: helix-turn-helix domain-containing protein [Deltaproteobacteria bacterium]|nr:helix-turn-helix domain-containing protein [Deltaproteobacteria bacterium]
MTTPLSPVLERWIAALPEDERAAARAHARYGAVHQRLVQDMRILLRAHGVSQRDLAERMGTSESAISRMLDDETARGIKLDTIVRFAEAIGVDVAASFFVDPALVAPKPQLPRVWNVPVAASLPGAWKCIASETRPTPKSKHESADVLVAA